MTGLRFKTGPHGVKFHSGPCSVHSSMAFATMVVEGVCRGYGVECVITSAFDGEHKPGSLHYEGKALDYRTRDIPKLSRERFAKDVAERLPPGYDVVLESTHLHVEYDP